MTSDPTENVVSFIRDYDRIYGVEHPNFYVGTYSQALNEAKKDLKFVLAYLHCTEHENSRSITQYNHPTTNQMNWRFFNNHFRRFCEETLSDRRVIELVNDNCLFWGCGVDSAEGYRVSQSLRENTYPFLAVIVQREYRMTVVGR